MGDPRKQRRKYSRPKHPWKIERITEEKELCSKYGLKNRKEIWMAKSTVGKFRKQTKALLLGGGEEVEKEKSELLEKLNKLGLLETKSLEAVLSLTIDDLLNRRLQTIVYKKGLANTIKQARQFVTHGHILIGDTVVNIPHYYVLKAEEDMITASDKIKVVNVGREGEKEAGSKEAG